MKQQSKTRARRGNVSRRLAAQQTPTTRRFQFETLEPRIVLTVSLRSGAVSDNVVLYPDSQAGSYQIAADPIDANAIEMIDLSVVTDEDQRHRLPGHEGLTERDATLVQVDPTLTYSITTRSFNPALEPNISTKITGALTVIAYDIDQNLIEPIHVARHDYAVDTTLARTLSPGDKAFYIVNASGWSNTLFESAVTRAIAWYGYTDQTGHTYDDYTYTRHIAADAEDGLWKPGGIRYDASVGAYRIDLLKPWDGPTILAGSAIRNAVAAQNPLSLIAAESKPEEHLVIDYAGSFGGGVWQDGVPDEQAFPPGTAYVSADFSNARIPVADVVIGPANDDDFGMPDDPTRPTLSRGGDHRVRLEFDVLSKGALPSFTPGMAGNFDADDNIDGGDFLLLQRGLGSTYSTSDLDDWQASYGSIGCVVLASVGAPTHGLAQIITNLNGQLAIDYQSAPWFVGTDLVPYTLRNTASGQTFEGTVAVEVLGSNVEQDPALVTTLENQAQVVEGNVVPEKQSVWNFFQYVIDAGSNLIADGRRNLDLLDHFDDPTDELVVRLLDGPANGSLTLGYDGTFEYVSKPGFAGTETFKFEVFDGLHTTTEIATINVVATPDELLEHRMREIALAMDYFEAVKGRFPVSDGFDGTGNPLLSWRVHLLPYLGYQELYDQFDLDEGWDSAGNLPRAFDMPDVFRSPGDSPLSANTRYQTFTGPDATFGRFTDGSDQEGPRLREFTDGSQHTILFAHAGADQAALWIQPDDLEFEATDPLASLGTITEDKITIATADGSVRHISTSVDAEDFKALVTMDGGEVVDAGTLARQYREESGQSIEHPFLVDLRENSRFRQIGLGILNYADSRNSLPSNAIDRQDGSVLYSWRVALLPFLGYQSLYDQFDRLAAWDSPQNLALLDEMPDIYRSLGDSSTSTTTRIQFITDSTDMPQIGFLDPRAAGQSPNLRPIRTSLARIRDGLSDTIGFVEAGSNKAVPWTKPDDLIWNYEDPIASFGYLPDGEFRAGMLDARTLTIPNAIDSTTLTNLAQRADGNPLDAATLRNKQQQENGIHKSPQQRLNELKKVVLGMLEYENVIGRFPSNRTDGQGNSLLSWRVQILPFLEQGSLYEQFRQDEPWDSPHNLSLLKYMPDVFRSPEDPTDSTMTRLSTFTGENAPFDSVGIGPQFHRINDGPSNTIAFVEGGQGAAVPWTKPVDFDFYENNPLSVLGELGANFGAAFFDGHVESLSGAISNSELSARITHQGGEDLGNLPEVTPNWDYYISQSGGDTILNEFGVDTFDVVLDRAPQSLVEIAMAVSDPAVATLDPSIVSFTPENWNVPQRVAVRGVDNYVINADQSVLVTAVVNLFSSDPNFALNASIRQFTATIVDDDLVPGDFNSSGGVDAADLGIWFSSFGQNSGADADRDGDTDGSDFLAWQRNRNDAAASLAAIATSSTVVDEVHSMASQTEIADLEGLQLAAAAAEWLLDDDSLDDELIEQVFDS